MPFEILGKKNRLKRERKILRTSNLSWCTTAFVWLLNWKNVEYSPVFPSANCATLKSYFVCQNFLASNKVGRKILKKELRKSSYKNDIFPTKRWQTGSLGEKMPMWGFSHLILKNPPNQGKGWLWHISNQYPLGHNLFAEGRRMCPEEPRAVYNNEAQPIRGVLFQHQAQGLTPSASEFWRWIFGNGSRAHGWNVPSHVPIIPFFLKKSDLSFL